MRVLVTGGNGFVAQQLCFQLQESGNIVISADRSATASSGIINCDLSDYAEAKRIILKHAPEQIYHLAELSLTSLLLIGPRTVCQRRIFLILSAR